VQNAYIVLLCLSFNSHVKPWGIAEIIFVRFDAGEFVLKFLTYLNAGYNQITAKETVRGDLHALLHPSPP
jgi:hypothetical protein